VLTVWASVALTTDATYFWPIWPILGAGIGLVSHAVSIPRLKQSRWQSMLPIAYTGSRDLLRPW
jgi:hypothetical protein